MRLILSLVAIATVLVPVPAGAQPVAAAPAVIKQRVTLKVTSMPLSAFLDQLSAKAKISFVLGEGVGRERVSADLHDVPVEEALDVLGRIKGLGYRRLGESDTYLVTARPEGAGSRGKLILTGEVPGLATRGSLERKGTLKEFFDALSKQSRLTFVLAPGVESRRMSGSYRNVTTRELLEMIAAVKNLTIRQTGKAAFMVEPAP